MYTKLITSLYLNIYTTMHPIFLEYTQFKNPSVAKKYSCVHLSLEKNYQTFGKNTIVNETKIVNCSVLYFIYLFEMNYWVNFISPLCTPFVFLSFQQIIMFGHQHKSNTLIHSTELHKLENKWLCRNKLHTCVCFFKHNNLIFLKAPVLHIFDSVLFLYEKLNLLRVVIFEVKARVLVK